MLYLIKFSATSFNVFTVWSFLWRHPFRSLCVQNAKVRANGRNIAVQQLPTMLGVVASICT